MYTNVWFLVLIWYDMKICNHVLTDMVALHLTWKIKAYFLINYSSVFFKSSLETYFKAPCEFSNSFSTIIPLWPLGSSYRVFFLIERKLDENTRLDRITQYDAGFVSIASAVSNMNIAGKSVLFTGIHDINTFNYRQHDIHDAGIEYSKNQPNAHDARW